MTAAVHCIVCRSAPTADPAGFSCAECMKKLLREPSGIFSAEHDVALSYPDDAAALLAKAEDSSFWFRHRNDVIEALLDRYPVNGAIWDVGGGNGYQARMLERSGHTVVLVEPGMAGCENAIARGVTRVVRATLGALHLKDASAAAITLFDVVEHLSDPRELLGECRRVLAPEGRLVVTVPAYETLWSDEDDYAQHHRRYTRRRLEVELEAAGFEVEHATYFFQALVMPILLLRSLPYRVGRLTRLVLGKGGPGAPGATDVGEHSPGGLSQRAVEALLARELTAIHRGEQLRFGGSIIAVARPGPRSGPNAAGRNE